MTQTTNCSSYKSGQRCKQFTFIKSNIRYKPTRLQQHTIQISLNNTLNIDFTFAILVYWIDSWDSTSVILTTSFFMYIITSMNTCSSLSHDKANFTDSISMIVFRNILSTLWSLLQLSPPNYLSLCELDTLVESG